MPNQAEISLTEPHELKAEGQPIYLHVWKAESRQAKEGRIRQQGTRPRVLKPFRSRAGRGGKQESVEPISQAGDSAPKTLSI